MQDTSRKLGKLPPRHDHRTLMLAKYTVALPPPPAAVDWSRKLDHLGMMKNDTLHLRGDRPHDPDLDVADHQAGHHFRRANRRAVIRLRAPQVMQVRPRAS
jgi:hypothetical protein